MYVKRDCVPVIVCSKWRVLVKLLNWLKSTMSLSILRSDESLFAWGVWWYAEGPSLICFIRRHCFMKICVKDKCLLCIEKIFYVHLVGKSKEISQVYQARAKPCHFPSLLPFMPFVPVLNFVLYIIMLLCLYILWLGRSLAISFPFSLLLSPFMSYYWCGFMQCQMKKSGYWLIVNM